MISLFLLVSLLVAVGAKIPRNELPPELRDCEHDRNDAIDCVLKYGDANGDRLLCWEEIKQLKSNMLYSYEKLLSLLHPQSDIMEHCDFDRDMLISEEDFDASLATCLHICSDINKFFHYICDRAAAESPPYVPPLVECKRREDYVRSLE